jgi:hypothetical protein
LVLLASCSSLALNNLLLLLLASFILLGSSGKLARKVAG